MKMLCSAALWRLPLAGDAIPIQLNDVHSCENTGTQPLEFLIVGVSRDNTRRVDSVDVSGTRRTGN
jgi:oxalate decarboxylase/phosphoglucose isomerase-like protein (cupin superfamily)